MSTTDRSVKTNAKRFEWMGKFYLSFPRLTRHNNSLSFNDLPEATR